jgi:hypothetical protein
VEGKRIFNTEVAKMQFNTRTSDLGGLFGVGEVGDMAECIGTEEEIILKWKLKQ